MNDSSTSSTTNGAAQPDLRTVVNFLCGNGMLLGRWFFDGPPAGEKDRYWWRKHLRASFAASTVTASAEALEALKGRISRIGLDIDRALAGQLVEQSPVAGRLKQIAALARAAAPAAEAAHIRPIQRFNLRVAIVNPESNGLYVRYVDHVAHIEAARTAAPAAFPVAEGLDIDRVLQLADEHADESREDGTRLMDRGGLLTFATDLIRIVASAQAPTAAAREPACKACDDTGMAVRCYDGASITHVFDCDQCSRPAPAPASLTQDMESVLIDGVAYQTPAPVAAELLGLHLEVRALTALAAEASDAPPTARKPLTDEQIDGLAVDSDGLPNSHLEFARAIEAAHGIEP